MAGELGRLLRLLVQADKEAVVTAVETGTAAVEFTSQLTSENTRKVIGVYNNSNTSSGEAFFGFSPTMSSSGESMPLPVGTFFDIEVADVDAIDLYFMSKSGEVGDLRVMELA